MNSMLTKPNAAALAKSPAATLARGAAAANSARNLTNAVAGINDEVRLAKALTALPQVAFITNKAELKQFLLDYAAGRGLQDSQRQFIFKPEPSGKGPITEVCNMLQVVTGQKPLIDIDSGKPIKAKFPITAFVSDLFIAAGMSPPPSTRLNRLVATDFEVLGGGRSRVSFGKSTSTTAEQLAKKFDDAGYILQEGRREKGLDTSQPLSKEAVYALAKSRVKYYAQMVKDLKSISAEIAQLGTEEARTRSEKLKVFAQEILDQHFKGMKLEEIPARKALQVIANNADFGKFKNEIKEAQSLSADKCNVASIKDLMLGDSKEGRALAAKEFVYHLSNYYQMFPKGEVEVINTYLKYMLHPDYASMKWDIVALSTKAENGATRGVAGIHFQAPDPKVILTELEEAKPGLLKKRLGIEPKDLDAYLAKFTREEKAIISSAWVEHFYRNPTEKPEVGRQLIDQALGIAKRYGNGVVSFEHEDVKKCSWQLNLYSSGMVGLHPNERALAYAVSGGARIMVDPKTKEPLLNVQPELQKGGEQNYDLAWGFIFKEGKPPATLSIAAVKTFLLARYGTIDAIDPRDDKTKGKPTAFAQMFDRLNLLERQGIKEVNFVPSRDVFFRDPK